MRTRCERAPRRRRGPGPSWSASSDSAREKSASNHQSDSSSKLASNDSTLSRSTTPRGAGANLVQNGLVLEQAAAVEEVARVAALGQPRQERRVHLAKERAIIGDPS
jgi:hypothetical protein